MNKKHKYKLFTNPQRTSFELWWFTDYGTKNVELHSKNFKTQSEAERFIHNYKQ